ncbi:MAG: hypothetical protein J5582_01790 [Ruminococcus sp.]|uniref:hypothetical protein n=1 Tax=Ruminococcus sp. TaxID=41978 RepID=UPI0025EB5638|nr:hypothetical protein [Ruminococcus sp.]MBO4865291.1 hypothetical protein [Ruminococcus sp.]
MKRTLSVITAVIAAAAASTFSAFAGDIELDTKKAVETDNGVTFTADSKNLAASQFTADTTVTVAYSGGESDKSSVKLVLDYWDKSNTSEFDFGSPATAEVTASEFKDGEAVFTYADITAALGDNALSSVFAIDVEADGSAVTCTGFTATNVLSSNEMAEDDIRRTIRVHAKKPATSENWGQSISVGVDQFDVSTLAENSFVIAVFESELEKDVVSAPVEFILQSTDDTVSPKAKNNTVWGKVAPVLFNNKYALFDFESMADAYGTDDFSCVSTVYVGDTGKSPITCTDIYALDIRTIAKDEPEVTDDSEVTSDSNDTVETTKPAETQAPAAVTEKDSSSSDDKDEEGSNFKLIVIGIIAGVVVAAGVIFLILGRKSRETYDVNKHRYVKK